MLKSMTGFAKVETETAEGKLSVEGRSLNNRYLEISIKLPKSDYLTEQRLRELIKRYVKRGKVDISFKWERGVEQSAFPRINEQVVTQYVELARTLKERYDLAGDVTVENVFNLNNVFSYEEGNGIIEESFLPACEALIARLLEEKRIEGVMIEKDLLARLDTIAKAVNEIEERWPETINDHEAKLKARIREVACAADVDEARLLQELALYMERLDITEEIVRLRGHIDHFRQAARNEEPVGRKLDFIIQEMVREANTIGSKSANLYINERAILIKVEIEKIREQVQNVE
jgi:uncharacterized protein (TIGR00255 family)